MDSGGNGNKETWEQVVRERALGRGAGLLTGGGATALYYETQQQGGQRGQWADGQWGE